MSPFNFEDKIYIMMGECKHPTKKVQPEMTPPSLPIFESTAT
jgi:hypothetical protein